MKIVIIGAGSGFGGRLSIDIMSRETLRDSTICLVDIHPSRLEQVRGYVQRTIDRYELPTKVVATTQRTEVLPDADFVITSVAALIFSFLVNPIYEAKTTIMIEQDGGMQQSLFGAGGFMDRETEINNQVEILKSRTLAEEVLSGLRESVETDRFSLIQDLKEGATQDDAVQALRDNLTIVPLRETDIIEITYTGPDPTIGTRLLNELKATYTRRTMAWVQQHLEGLRDYYAVETAGAMELLRAAEREQTRLHLDNPYLKPRYPGALSNKLSQLESERNELLRRRREYVADLEGQRQILASIEAQYVSRNTLTAPGEEDSPSGYLSPKAIHLMGLIEEIDGKVRELRRTRGMTDEHPEIKELLAARRWHETELATQHARDHEMAVSNGPLETEWPFNIAGANVPGEPWQSDRARLLVQIAG